MRDDLGPPALLHKRPLGEVGGAHVLLMAVRDGEVIETGLRIVPQTATRFGKLALIARHDRLAPLPGRLARGRIAHIDHQRIRNDWGHIVSMALVSPTAPSVVIVTGGCSPRLTRARSTSKQLS